VKRACRGTKVAAAGVSGAFQTWRFLDACAHTRCPHFRGHATRPSYNPLLAKAVYSAVHVVYMAIVKPVVVEAHVRVTPLV
jgi:hypothetical protein